MTLIFIMQLQVGITAIQHINLHLLNSRISLCMSRNLLPAILFICFCESLCVDYRNPFPSSMNPKTSPDPQPQILPLRIPSLQLRPVVLFPLLSLPIPPLLSLLYLAAGYVILSQIYKSSSSSIYHTPILSIHRSRRNGWSYLLITSRLYPISPHILQQKTSTR
jgi:hypothetical protein